jgi:hypothetical protein
MRVNVWDRTDSRVLQAALGLAFVIQVVAGFLIPLLHIGGLFGVANSRAVAATGQPTTLAESGGLKLATDSTSLTVTDPGVGQRVLLELPTVVTAVLVLVGIYWLFQIARTLSAGDPFVPRNPLRLFGIAGLLAVGTMLDGLLTAITTDRLVSGTPLQERVPFSVHFSLTPILVAFLLAALAEAFRIGVRLRDDTEGLV